MRFEKPGAFWTGQLHGCPSPLSFNNYSRAGPGRPGCVEIIRRMAGAGKAKSSICANSEAKIPQFRFRTELKHSRLYCVIKEDDPLGSPKSVIGRLATNLGRC